MLTEYEVLAIFAKSGKISFAVNAVIADMMRSGEDMKARKKTATEYVERIIYEDLLAMAKKM